MMEGRLILWIAFHVLFLNEISLVQTADECKTHADCAGNLLYKYCCAGGDSSNLTRLTCRFGDCEGKYCETAETHCGDSTLCCHSNECVDRGCSGCASDSDCTSGQVCCKKSFPKAQTVCAEKCVGLECNSNDDCAGTRECCRDNKCVGGLLSFACFAQCKSNSECHLGEYCCKKKWVWFWQDRCSETCVDEDCSSDDDCGPPNENCIDAKCAKDDRPAECTSDSDCTSGLHCCEKRDSNGASECLTDCNGGGPGPGPSEVSDESSPPWRIAVIVIVGLLAISVTIAVYWCYKRKRSSTAAQVNRGSLQITQSQGTAITNPKSQFTGFNNPTQQQGTAFALHPRTDRHQQDTLDNDGYVISRDQINENPDVGPITQKQAGSQWYPQNASNPYNPPPLPGNHP